MRKVQKNYLASTSVEMRPGMILSISTPNRTTSLSIANCTCACRVLKQKNKYNLQYCTFFALDNFFFLRRLNNSIIMIKIMQYI